MRDALRGLTTRGRSFLAAGRSRRWSRPRRPRRAATCCGSASCSSRCRCWPRWSWRAPATGCRRARRLELRAGPPPASEAAVHAAAGEHLPAAHRPAAASRTGCPTCSGAGPRFVLDRVEPRGRREVTYTVRSDVRGRYTLGPLAIRLTDPFGMCELSRSFTARDTLIVVPRRSQPLPAVRARRRVDGQRREPGPRRWPAPARTTSRPASTGTATTCAGCTGGPPRGSAS